MRIPNDFVLACFWLDPQKPEFTYDKLRFAKFSRQVDLDFLFSQICNCEAHTYDFGFKKCLFPGCI